MKFNPLMALAVFLAVMGIGSRAAGFYLDPWLTWSMIAAPVVIGFIQGWRGKV